MLPAPGGKDSGESGDVSPGTRLRRNIFKLKFHSREAAMANGDDSATEDRDGKARRMSVFKFGMFGCGLFLIYTFLGLRYAFLQFLLVSIFVKNSEACFLYPIMLSSSTAIHQKKNA